MHYDIYYRMLGAQIAVEYAKIASEHQNGKKVSCIPNRFATYLTGTQHFYGDFSRNPSSQIIQNSNPVEYGSGSAATKDTISSVQKATVVVVGCAAVDVTSQADTPIRPDQRSTFPGKVSVSLGGVARNIAEATHRVMYGSTGTDALPLLVAPIGDDEFGRLISAMTRSLGMRTDGLMPIQGRQSAVCNLLLDSHGELQCGVSDMDLPHAWEADQVGMTPIKYSWFSPDML